MKAEEIPPCHCTGEMLERGETCGLSICPNLIQAPTVNERGDDVHPSWALIGASRISSSHGQPLFDSDILHRHFVRITLRRASRHRSLNHDRLYGEKEIISVDVSEAQWGAFVSSFGIGNGVPCTIEREGFHAVPQAPHEPRMAESMKEVDGAVAKAMAPIHEALKACLEKNTKGNLRALESAINLAAPNIKFAATAMNEYAEDVVTKSQADIEAMIIGAAKQVGIDPADLGEMPQLGAGGDS